MKVTMFNVAGYENRTIELKSESGIDANKKFEFSMDENRSEVQASEPSSYTSSSDNFKFKAYISGNNFIIEFKLDNLWFNSFELNTYYTPYKYQVKYHNNTYNSSNVSSDAIVKTITEYQNVKPKVTYVDMVATVVRAGYTLMGYTENQAFASLRSVGSSKPAMYYQHSEDKPYLVKYEDGGILSALENSDYQREYVGDGNYFYNYNQMKTKGTSNPLAECYDWDWYSAISSGYYYIDKNLNQDTRDSTNPTNNAVIDMYAIWHANNYVVKYNATSYGTTEIKIDYNNDGNYEKVYDTTDAAGNKLPLSDVETTIKDSSGNIYTTDVNEDHMFRTDFINAENKEYGSETSEFKFPTLDREGYIFVGWSYFSFALKYDDNLLNPEDVYPVNMAGQKLTHGELPDWRHRAGVGMSEASDAVVVIVSEETGTISVAVGGMLKRHLAPQTLEKLLHKELGKKEEETAQTGSPVLRLMRKLLAGEEKNHEE